MERLESVHNPKIVRLLELQQKSRLRRASGLFPLEGRREISRCKAAGFQIALVFVCPEIYGNPDSEPFLEELGKEGTEIFSVSAQVYSKIAYREGTEGIVAEVKAVYPSLSDINLPADGRAPLVIVMESVEKPGNLGAVLRSADAVGADAVIVCDPLTDIYNPNLVRASTGAVFTVPTVVCTSDQAIEWLKANGLAILTAQLQDSSLYYDCDMTGPTAIVTGTESTGLSDKWRRAATAHIRIPMLGLLDSLNVSVSAAILLYEALRQRRNGTIL